MKNIVFLVHGSARNWGSAIVRTQQLAALAIDLFGSKGMNINYTSDYISIKDAIVFIHKTFFEKSGDKELSYIKHNGNIIVADYIDQITDDIHIDFVDCLMASSRKQESYFRRTYPNKLVFHVTHSTDSRLPDISVQEKTFSPGYFGAVDNTIYKDELKTLVDFIETTADDTGWMLELKAHNCHYAARNRQQRDGFKPFLKGFTAAKYGCPIITLATEDDAIEYLGNDYPYLISDTSLGAVRDMILQAASDFGGARWKTAVAIMDEVRARSSPDVVRKEFHDLVVYLAGNSSAYIRRRTFTPFWFLK